MQTVETLGRTPPLSIKDKKKPAAIGKPTTLKRWLWLLLVIPLAIGYFVINQFKGCNPKESTEGGGGVIPKSVDTSSQLIKTEPTPMAGFSVENDDCEAPCEVHFTNQSKNADSFTWDFGDTHSSSDQNPKNRYQNAGTYTVRLIAMKGSYQNTYTQEIHIAEKTVVATKPVSPIAAFEMDKNQCDAPCIIRFTNKSKNASKYKWYINGTLISSEMNSDYRFDNAGSFKVKLLAINQSGDDSFTKQVQINQSTPNIVADFDVENKRYVAPCTIKFTNRSLNAESFNWSINNQTASSNSDLTYEFRNAGTYTIQLTASKNSESKSKSKTIYITNPPALIVSFTPSMTTCTAPCTINFVNRSQNAQKLTWMINGTEVSNSLNLTHQFTNAGNYTVQLFASRGSESKSFSGTVKVNAAVLPLVADFNSPPIANLTVPVTLTFRNQSRNAERYVWEIRNADGRTTRTDNHLTFNFIKAGIYTISLTAFRGTESKVKQMNITFVGQTLPSALFVSDKTTCNVPCTINFTNRSQNAEKYVWNISSVDGSANSVNQNFSFDFNKAGTYTVKLKAINGNQSTTYQKVYNIR